MGRGDDMFERFTDRSRRVLVLAQEEARRLDHNFIGTEHILLGLIDESEGVAARTLASLGITREAVRDKVLEKVGPGPASSSAAGSPPFTPRAKKVLELSLREALQLGHNYIGTEHTCFSAWFARAREARPRSWWGSVLNCNNSARK
jgi:ATP-dependent Clp protease ATP-binding subunit ClpC